MCDGDKANRDWHSTNESERAGEQEECSKRKSENIEDLNEEIRYTCTMMGSGIEWGSKTQNYIPFRFVHWIIYIYTHTKMSSSVLYDDRWWCRGLLFVMFTVGVAILVVSKIKIEIVAEAAVA